LKTSELEYKTESIPILVHESAHEIESKPDSVPESFQKLEPESMRKAVDETELNPNSALYIIRNKDISDWQ